MTTVCFCNFVTEEEIKTFLEKYPNASFQDVQKNTGASTSCGRCALSVKKTVERIKANIPQSNQLSLF